MYFIYDDDNDNDDDDNDNDNDDDSNCKLMITQIFFLSKITIYFYC